MTENKTPPASPRQKKVQSVTMTTTDTVKPKTTGSNGKKKSKGKKRCCHESCNKKLTLVQKSLACKCGKYFCSSHRFESQHNCSFDFKSSQKNILQSRLLNGKIVNECFTKL